MKKAILVAIIGAMALGVNAKDWGKAPVMDKTPIEECYDISGEVSLGYDTDYIFNGVRFARDSVWADANYTFDSLWAPITVGAWYLTGAHGLSETYGELNVYASVGLGSYAGVDVSLGYTYFFFSDSYFPPSGTDHGEINIDLAYSLGFVDVIWSSDYAHNSDEEGWSPVEGWFHTFGLERGFGITDTVSLVLGAGVGYSDGYNVGLTRSSGWNHYYVTASLPVELNCRATLTPYVGYNGGPSAWIVNGISGVPFGQPQSDILHGGVSLSVSF